MRFDTRDKKPKLWNVLIQAIFVAVVLLLMIRDGAPRHAVTISALIALFLLAALIQLIAAFFRQIQYNPYSYNTIYYMGFALFLLAVWILQLRLLVLLIRQPEQYGAGDVLYLLLGSAKNYMLLTSPFLLAFSAAL